MTEQERAGEHLKVIRQLLERATVYRALSWQTAIFGGAVATILATLLYLREELVVEKHPEAERAFMSDVGWVAAWIIALVVVVLFNTLLVWRQSKKDGRPFFSSGLRLALRATVPPMLIGGILGIGRALAANGSAAEGAAIWVCCYGLALIATTGLAPPSIPRLGWVFLVAGVLAYGFVWGEGARPLPMGYSAQRLPSPLLESNLIMGVCFGLFHLGYGWIMMKLTPRDEVEPSDDE